MQSHMRSHMRCNQPTKKGTLCQNIAGKCRYHSGDLRHGEGIRDVLHTATRPLHGIPFIGKRIKYAIEGPRKIATKRLTHFMNTIGDQKVVSLEIARKPIEGPVETALNVLSFGKFNKIKKKLAYDDVYHNYLLATLEDGHQYVLHKNHVIESRKANAADLRNERYGVTLPADQTLTLKGMFNRALLTDKGQPATEESQRRLIQYDPSAANCQFFTKEMLEDNDLAPSDPKGLELLQTQDSSQLVSSLGMLAPVAKAVTDTAASFDRFIYGDGSRVFRLKGRHGSAK